MTIPVKVLTTALLGSCVIGGGVAYSLLTKSISIKEQLSNDNKKLLTSEEEALWKIKLSTYTSLNNTNTKIKLDKEEKWENLKSWCEEKVKEDFNDKNKELYQGVKQICTVPSNREKLTSLTKALATKPEHWKAKEQAYKSEGTSPITTISKDQESVIEGLKEWCKISLEEEFTKDVSGSYKLTLKWCTEKGE